MNISLIACIAKNGAMGYQGKLLYNLPDDMARFRQLTSGHTVIMGRKTYESLPGGALPNRRNIVLSHSLNSLPDCEVIHTLEEALKNCKNHSALNNIVNDPIYIIGGAEIYQLALSYATDLHLTIVDDTTKKADVFFPLTEKDIKEMLLQGWSIKEEVNKHTNEYAYKFLWLTKNAQNK